MVAFAISFPIAAAVVGITAGTKRVHDNEDEEEGGRGSEGNWRYTCGEISLISCEIRNL